MKVPRDVEEEERSAERKKIEMHRVEERRKYALGCLPSELGKEGLEFCPLPVVVYGSRRIYYANSAALERFGYDFKQLRTFNDATVDTGKNKRTVDDILDTCAATGLHNIDLQIRITRTLDGKELFIEPQMKYFDNGADSYWIAYIMHMSKTDPSTATGKAKNMLRNLMSLFEGKFQHLPAPEYVDINYANSVLRHLGTAETPRLLLNFKKTTGFDKPALDILCELANTTSFKDSFFKVDNEETHYLLKSHKVPSERIYRPRSLNLEAATA